MQKDLKNILGFTYTPPKTKAEAKPDKERAIFRAKKAFEEIIFNTVKLEGNPFTFPEVKTVLDGITVGGRKLSDEKQIQSQGASWKEMMKRVKEETFKMDRETFCQLHAIAAEDESLTWGKFRDGDVGIAGTEHKPSKADQLDEIFEKGLSHINQIKNPLERGMTFFLFGSINQFFYDVNKRTSRLMMNGTLLSSGLDVINIPAKKQLEFNEKMIRFYDSEDGTEMMEFLEGCQLG
jgi:Fic family protein